MKLNAARSTPLPLCFAPPFGARKLPRPAAAGVAVNWVLLGPGLADGYLDLPRLTADRFAPSACGERGARMYHTGLPARTDADGALELLGQEPSFRRVR